MKRFLWLGFVLSVYLICTGCGETFRPIIIPNPPTFPNPSASNSVLTVNDNGDFTQGSAMSIDVAGDADISNHNVDIHPVHAVQQTASEVLVVNQAVNGLNIGTTTCLVVETPPPPQPPTTYDVCPSLWKLSFNGESISSTSSVSLPIYAGANFVASAPSDSLAYVAMPTYPPDPTVPTAIQPSVQVVNTLSNVLGPILPVGSNPYALAVTFDKTKLYVANEGDSTISGFDTNSGNPSSRTGSPTSTSSSPIWLTARADSQAVYVLEKDGLLAWLNTTSTAGPDIFTETSNPAISIPGATLMVYDPNKNRLYIPGESQLGIVDVSQSPPQYLSGGSIKGPITTCQVSQTNCIATVLPSLRATTDPCYSTSPQALTIVAAAALPDGSQAYVGAYYVDSADNICPQVTPIDAVSFAVGTSIAIPGFPDATSPTLSGGAQNPYYVPACVNARFRFMMAAGGDSSRTYLSSCDGGAVNIVDTTIESYIEDLPAPIGARAPIPPNLLNPSQNPIFLLAGP
jgi:DNA-binding beta-propeller fold protein YncE